jgi:hypothetical protein
MTESYQTEIIELQSIKNDASYGSIDLTDKIDQSNTEQKTSLSKCIIFCLIMFTVLNLILLIEKINYINDATYKSYWLLILTCTGSFIYDIIILLIIDTIYVSHVELEPNKRKKISYFLIFLVTMDIIKFLTLGYIFINYFSDNNKIIMYPKDYFESIFALNYAYHVLTFMLLIGLTMLIIGI